MGTIKYGTTEFSNIKVGDSQVLKVYIGSDLVWKSQLEPMTKILHSTDIKAITHTANNIIVAGTNGTIYYYDKNLANLGSFSTNYGGTVRRMLANSTDLYVYGNTTDKVYKYNLTSKTKTAETTYTYNAYYAVAGMTIDNNNNIYICYTSSDGYSNIKKFGSRLGSELDSGRVMNMVFYKLVYSNSYLYCIHKAESNMFRIYKFHVSDLSTVVASTANINGGASYQTDIGLSTDGTHLYVGTQGSKLFKILQSDLSIVSTNENAMTDIRDTVVVGDFVYGMGSSKIIKYDKNLNIIKSSNTLSDGKYLSLNAATYIGENLYVAEGSNYISKYSL